MTMMTTAQSTPFNANLKNEIDIKKPMKEVYFDGLMLENILSFIPKHVARSLTFSELEQGQFYEVISSDPKNTVKVIVIRRLTRCFMTYDFVDKIVYEKTLNWASLDGTFRMGHCHKIRTKSIDDPERKDNLDREYIKHDNMIFYACQLVKTKDERFSKYNL